MLLPEWKKSLIFGIAMIVWFTSMVLASTIGYMIAERL